MDKTKIIQIDGIGAVNAQRQGTAVLVSVTDLVTGLGRATPAKVVAHRVEARISGRWRSGRTVHHMIDAPSAAALVAAMKGIDQQIKLRAVYALFELHAANAATQDIVDVAVPRWVKAGPKALPRPAGITVTEAISALGIKGEIDPRQAGKHVSQAYQGERHYHPDGLIFEDAAQVAALLTEFRARRRARLGDAIGGDEGPDL